VITSRKKTNIIEEYRVHDKDSGSVEIQTALLTKQITELITHLKKHPKDNHSRRGLLKMVGKRKKLLDYLDKNNKKSYTQVVKKLGLKK
jgi:small subunit ribosomal protein S15